MAVSALNSSFVMMAIRICAATAIPLATRKAQRPPAAMALSARNLKHATTVTPMHAEHATLLVQA
jgi:hypothetical protein